MPYLIHFEFDKYDEPIDALYYPAEDNEDKAIQYAGNMGMWVESTITVTKLDEKDLTDNEVNDNE